MWQPIETAPKDGSSILLSTPKGRIADGFWHVAYKVWSWPYVMVEPTHWMPLPDAPGAQAQPAPSVSDGWQLVPERLVEMFCGAADNLGDMPVSEAWAERWSNEASDLLEQHNYFREHAAPKPDNRERT